MKKFLVMIVLSMIAFSAHAENKYIPVAGIVRGHNGTFFRTDVRIFNPGTTFPIAVTLYFLPQGMDGRNIPGRVFTIGPREVLVLDDVVSQFVPESTSAIGAIRIDSDNGVSFPFLAESRTYTNSPHGRGTFGQFIPALTLDDAEAETAVLHITQTVEFRTNAGVMNPNDEPVTVKARLFGAEGNLLIDGPEFVVPPKTMQQTSLEQLFGGVYMPNGYIIFEASHPVFTWASIVDNDSGDQFFVRGEKDRR